MRKIISKNEKNDRVRKKQIIFGVVLIIVMFFSTIGYGFQRASNEEKQTSSINYNGFEFTNTNNYWVVQDSNPFLVFSYNPEQTDNLEVNITSLRNYAGKPLYFSSEDNSAKFELNRNLNPLSNSNGIILRMQEACYIDENCTADVPIKTCADNFIIIKESVDNKIYQENNCVFIEGKKEDLTKMTDEFLFHLFGIKE